MASACLYELLYMALALAAAAIPYTNSLFIVFCMKNGLYKLFVLL